MSIRDWHENDRPREKLLKYGAEHLTDAELLAIFLRVGVKGRSAVELSQDLLDYFGDLHSLLCAEEAEFCQAKGLGQAKYVQIRAILEMAERHFRSGIDKGDAFTQPEKVARFLQTQLGHQAREQFACLFLDQQHHLLAYETLFYGTLNQASVYPREIIKRALELNSAAIILAHNHPSGDPNPSQADIQLTEQIKQTLQLLDIRLLDHFVIGDLGRWCSLAQTGDI